LLNFQGTLLLMDILSASSFEIYHKTEAPFLSLMRRKLTADHRPLPFSVFLEPCGEMALEEIMVSLQYELTR